MSGINISGLIHKHTQHSHQCDLILTTTMKSLSHGLHYVHQHFLYIPHIHVHLYIPYMKLYMFVYAQTVCCVYDLNTSREAGVGIQNLESKTILGSRIQNLKLKTNLESRIQNLESKTILGSIIQNLESKKILESRIQNLSSIEMGVLDHFALYDNTGTGQGDQGLPVTLIYNGGSGTLYT